MTAAYLGRQWSPVEIAAKIVDLSDGRHANWNGVNVCATILGESGGYEHAINVNDHDPTSPSYLSLDLGICQWNTHHHIPETLEVDEAMTADTAIARMIQWGEDHADGWKLNLNIWNVYRRGVFRKHVSTAADAFREIGASL